MCGIAGAMMRGGKPVELSLLEKFGAAQAHRGPDGQGHFRQDAIGLAHQRLAIIDLVTGDQPLFGPDGVVLIANGEIYNNDELRIELTGASFLTHSDCEPPLFLYQQLGPAFAGRLRGMFAIALYDPGKLHLLLCRDPFGIKPLYYAETADGFLFASEPQALLASGLIERRIVTTARDELLNLQFTTGRETIFAGINRVLPGETLVIADGRIIARHRQAALTLAPPRVIDQSDALAALDAALEESVRLHQRSDVPYGLFLSGGIDSASLLAMMARLNRSKVLAFTAFFPDSLARDETDLAAQLATAIGAEHVKVAVTEADFWAMLPDIAGAMDDPAADYAILPTAKLAMTARQSVKVVLAGEGGDELFGGYGRYRAARRPWPLTRSMRRHGALDGMGLLREPARHWRDGLLRVEKDLQGASLDRLQRAQALDCADWLPNDLLGKLDRCLMAFGIEGRVPFLDLPLADFAFHLPDGLKIKQGRGKFLLREWLARRLPMARPFSRKRGFTVPVADWLAGQKRLGPLLATQPAIREICHPDRVEALFARLDRQRGFAAWTLLFYALWHRRHIDGAGRGGSVFETLGD
jgi:asparagine synthase (glutamine-hydrolysing)